MLFINQTFLKTSEWPDDFNLRPFSLMTHLVLWAKIPTLVKKCSTSCNENWSHQPESVRGDIRIAVQGENASGR